METNYLSGLSASEEQLLHKAPVLVGVIAAMKDGKASPSELKDAVKLAHFRTFTSSPILKAFYTACDRDFKKNLDHMMIELKRDEEGTMNQMHVDLTAIDIMIDKMPGEFRTALEQSLYSFGKHVSKADHSWLDDLALFVDPFIPLD